MTYLLLNTVFLAIAATVALIAARKGLVSRPRMITIALSLAVVLVLTAVFDNVIIATGLVAYDTSNISGLMVGLAPIEDFAYPVGAALLLPALWLLLGRFGERRATAADPAPRSKTNGTS